MVVLDTNIIIDHLRQPTNDSTILLRIVERRYSEGLTVSVISLEELYAGSSTRIAYEENRLLASISTFAILPFDFDIAKNAGILRRDYNLGFADAAIASTCLIYGAELVTLNQKDFSQIPKLRLSSV